MSGCFETHPVTRGSFTVDGVNQNHDHSSTGGLGITGVFTDEFGILPTSLSFSANWGCGGFDSNSSGSLDLTFLHSQIGSTLLRTVDGYVMQLRITKTQPDPTFLNLDDFYCADAANVNLSYSATGGTLTGPGTSGNTFSPGTLSPGTYTIRYETLPYYIVTKDVTIGDPVSFQTSKQDEVCDGQDDGAITVSNVTGSSPFSYSFDGGTTFQSGNTKSGLNPADYDVVVKDSQGCEKSTVVSINSAIAIGISIDVNDVLCFGDDGSVEIQGSGGSGSYTFAVDAQNFQNGSTISALSPGSHTAKVKDSNGCTAETTFTIGSANELLLSAAKTDETCYEEEDGTITVTASGGAGNLEYDIGNGYTSSPSFEGLSPNTYVIKVKDANNCIKSTSIKINAANELQLSTSKTDETCYQSEDGTISLSGSGGAGNLQFKITGTSYGSQVNFTDLSPGSYTAFVKDGNNCETSRSISIGTASEISIDLDADHESCFESEDGSIQINASGGNSSYTYALNNGSFQNADQFNDLAAGSYLIKVKDDNGCVKTTNSTINAANEITYSVNKTDPLCKGDDSGEISITASGGDGPLSYSIGSGFSSNPSFNGLEEDSYTIRIKDQNQCEKNQVIVLTDPPAIGFGLNVTAETCVGANDGRVDITLSGGTGGLLTNLDQAGFVADLSYTNLSPGNYPLAFKDANGCTVTTSFEVDAAVPLSFAVSEVFPNCGFSDGSITVTATGGVGNYMYSVNGQAQQTSDTFSSLSSGTYELAVRDGNNCISTLSYNLIDTTNIIISTTTTEETCNGNDGSITVSVTGGTGPFTYAVNGGLFGGSPTLTGLTQGTHQVTVKDVNGCLKVANAEVLGPNLFDLSANETPETCVGTNDGTIQVTATNGVGGFTYEIDGGGFGAVSLFSNLSPGSHTVAVKDANDCIKTLSVEIDPASPLSLNATASAESCVGSEDGSIVVHAIGGVGGFTYGIDNGLAATVNNFAGLSPGNHVVRLTDQNSCIKDTTIVIEAAVPMSISLTPIPVSCVGFADGAIAVSSSGGQGGFSYKLSTGNFQANDTLSNLIAGNYQVIVKDANGCLIQADTVIDPANPIQVTSAVIDESCVATNDGRISLAASGGQGAFSYELNTGGYQASGQFEDLIPASYSYNVQDQNNCIETGVLVVNPAKPLQSSFDLVNEHCGGTSDGSIEVIGSGGAGTLNFALNQAGFVAENSFQALAAGDYQITIKDSLGCLKSDSVTIGNDIFLDFQATVLPEQCFGAADGSVSILPIGGGSAPYSFQQNDDALVNSSSFLDLPSGDYQFTVIDAAGCLAKDSIEILAASQITAAASTIAETCVAANDGAIQLSPSGGTGTYQYQLDAGALGTSTQFTGLSPKSFDLKITDSNDCQLDTVIVVAAATPIVIDTTIVDESCVGFADGSLMLHPSGGVGGFSFSIDNAQFVSDSVFASLPVGSQNYFVRDGNGCLSTGVAEIQAANVIVVDYETTVETCYESKDGIITINASGGTEGFTYSINNGASFVNASVFENLVPDSYEVDVRDANQCLNETTLVIEAAPLLSLSVTSIDESCFEAEDGQISIIGSGGRGTLINQLDGNNVGNTISNLDGKTYTVALLDSMSCKVDTVITINTATQIAADFTITPETCVSANDGTIVAVASGGAGNYSYRFDLDNYNATSLREGISPNTYSYWIQDNNQCEREFSVTIDPAVPLEMTAITTDETCVNAADGVIELAVSGGSGDLLISQNGGTHLATTDFSNLIPNSYDFEVLDENGCVLSNTYLIKSAIPIVFQGSVVAETCVGADDGMVILTATGGQGGFTYGLSSNSLSSNNNVENLAPGNHSFTVEDLNGCSDQINLTIDQAVPIQMQVATIPESCNGSNDGEIEITASGGQGSFSYGILGAVSSVNNSFTNLAPGTYQTVIADQLGCIETQSISIMTRPALEISYQQIQPITEWGGANGAVSVSAAGGLAPYQVSWIFPNGSNADGTQIADLDTGLYQVTITDVNGCFVEDTLRFINPDPAVLVLSFAIDNAISCFNGTDGAIGLTTTNGQGSYGYQWTGPGGFNSTDEDLTQLQAGTYNVTATDLQSGAEGLGSFIITQPDSIVLSNPIVSLISGFDENDGAFSATAVGGSGNYQYSWTGPNQFQSAALNQTNLFPGEYQLLISDDNGCQGSYDFILINPLPTVVLFTFDESQSVSCNGGSDGELSVDVTQGTGSYSYSWTGPSGYTSSDVLNSGLSAGTYSLTITDLISDVTAEGVFELTQPAPINIQTVSLLQPSEYGAFDGYAEVSVSGGNGGYTYNWQGPNGFVATAATIDQVEAGVFEVQVTDTLGCQGVLSLDLSNPAPDSLILTISERSAISCFEGSDGSLTVDVFPTGTAYSYQWELPSGEIKTDQEISGLAKGIYTVTATSIVYGISAVASYEIGEPEPYVIGMQPTYVICRENELTIASETVAAQYEWFDSNNELLGSDSTVVLSSDGNFLLKTTSELGCVAEHTFDLTYSADYTASDFLMSSIVEEGDTVVLVDVSWPIPDSIAWFAEGNPITIDTSDFYLEVIYQQEGTYEIGMQAFFGACEFYLTQTLTVLVPTDDRPNRDDTEDLKYLNQVQLFPNPTTDRVKLSFNTLDDNQVHIRMLDIEGRKVIWQQQVDGQYKYEVGIDLGGFSQGLYLIEIISDRERKVLKVLKQ